MASYLDVYNLLPPLVWMALAGGLGGLFIDCLHKGYIELPSSLIKDGKKCYTLGFTAAIIAGIIAGTVADTSPLISFLAGAGLGGITTGVLTRTRNGKAKELPKTNGDKVTIFKEESKGGKDGPED